MHILETREPEEVPRLLEQIRDAGGLHVAGFLSYEAGHGLERKLAPLAFRPGPDQPPLLWFGVFEQVREVAADELLPSAAGAFARAPRPLIEREAYLAAVGRVKAHIEAGDIYQANFTFPSEVQFEGSPLALYSAIRRRARAGHGAVVFTGTHWLLSFSPELFFEMNDGRILTRPMKGTAARLGDEAAEIAALRGDEKQRAENLMIVDLLRNDLSRVSRPGSVKVPALFEVETYPTVHQMTSTVTAELEEGIDAAEVLRTIFPCGSVTGAPKIRAMEIIADVEGAPRGVYTGAIGWIGPDGQASFNVAIRTLTVPVGAQVAALGLGSGIVADSEAEAEWRECLTKGAFVASDGGAFDLLETMRFDPHDGVIELERHLARMKRSAEALGFGFDRHDARNELQAGTFRLRDHKKVRLLLSKTGAIAIETGPLPVSPEIADVTVRPLPVAGDDFRLRHKVTARRFYDEARRGAGAFETLFEDEEGFLTEGSFTTVFVERDGMLLTPPLSRGLLPGVLRDKLIAEARAAERDLRREDLKDGFFIGNMVRGLISARLV